MKQLIIPGIITLAIGLIVASFTHNLNKEYVDLRYALSEKIPTKFRETSPAESVQQLVVKNNGNISATQIQIKISGSIADYDLLKNSISDVVDEHKSKTHFEAIYPSLPPEGQFIYVFKTQGGGLSSRDIDIKHNKGKAQEALSGDRRPVYESVSSYLPISLLIFYLIMFAFQGRFMAITHLEAQGSYTNYYDYLNKKKPIYISQEKWDSIRREYIKEQIKPKLYSRYDVKIEEWESYKILNSDRPRFVSEDEWNLLKERALKSLEDEFSYILKSTNPYTDLDSLEKIFLLKKPKNMLDVRWTEIIKKINDTYTIIRQRRASSNRSRKDILKEIENGVPPGMLPEHWDDYIKYLLNLYYDLTYSDVLNRRINFEHLKEIDLMILSKDKIKELEDVAYKIRLLSLNDISSHIEAAAFIKRDKPAWVKKKDLEQLLEKAESYIALDKATKKYNALLFCINDVVRLNPLNKKPESIEDSDWDELREIEKQIVAAFNKIEEEKAKLETEKSKTTELKDKILKQLAIIDRILIEPEAISKIEGYDNPFSQGNFSNLIKICEMGLKLKKST